MKYILIPIITLLLFSCKAKKELTNETNKSQNEIAEQTDNQETTVNTIGDLSDNSKTSLDWVGSYSGVLPCADCEGIKTTMTLNSDLTFMLTSQYLGKSNEIFTVSGPFEWDSQGRYITLKHEIGDHYNYLVGENILKQLGRNAEMITSELSEYYNLYKIKNPLVGKYWKLVELDGLAIEQTEEMKEPHIRFTSDMQVNGTGGCNSFFATYTSEAKLQLRFGHFGMTEMACHFDNYDQALVDALSLTSNYVIVGEDELRLQVGKRMPHAIFKAVYF